jgi:hypothetical protein
VIKVLEGLAIQYVIGGSIASIIHGMSRSTLDADILVDIRQNQVAAFLAGLKGAFYVDEKAINRAIEHRSSFNLIHLTTMFKVDIFIPKRPFDQQQLNRRISEKIGVDSDEQIWLLSPEDVILAKLDWFRMGGEVSERQWRDVLGVMKTQHGSLDIDYLKAWAEKLNVTDLLEQALEEMTI